MPDLILLAAGGLAREVLSVLDATGAYNVLGFLDDELSLAGTEVAGLPVLGPLDEIDRFPDARLLVCAGRGQTRRRIVDRLTDRGVVDDRYATVADPRVDVPATGRVGAGTILLAQTVLTADVQIGRHVVVMPHVTLTHDDVVEDFATLCAGVTLGGDVTVGLAAYVGMNASVRERTVIGPEATVGMGAVVLTDVPGGDVWAGVPARSLKKVAPW